MSNPCVECYPEGCPIPKESHFIEELGYWYRCVDHWQIWTCDYHGGDCEGPECSNGNWSTSIWARWSHGG